MAVLKAFVKGVISVNHVTRTLKAGLVVTAFALSPSYRKGTGHVGGSKGRIILKRIGNKSGGVDRIHLSQDRNRKSALANTEMSLPVS